MRILWVGPVIHERFFANPAVSAAASIWQQGLIHALMQQPHLATLRLASGSTKRNQLDLASGINPIGPKASFSVISHLPSQSFPKGAFWPQHDKSIFPQGYAGCGVGYCNLPILRDWVLSHQYDQQIGQVLATNQHRPFDLLVSYNAEPYVSASVAKWAQKQALPWVSIIADLPKREPIAYLEKAKIAHADGRLFLSWKNFQDFGKPDSDLFLEGGVYSIVEHGGENSNGANSHAFSVVVSNEKILAGHHKKRIAYFGGLTTLGGIDLFLQSTRQLTGSQYEFHIIGAGDTTSRERAQEFARADARVQYHGPVAEQALIQLGQQMDVFIDPRPKAMSENNFPSKLLTYLRFAKPIISTIGHGISPEYQSVLVPLYEEDPSALARLIESVCEWDVGRAREYEQTVKQFVLNHKSWQVQGQRAGEWMHTIVKRHRQSHA